LPRGRIPKRNCELPSGSSVDTHAREAGREGLYARTPVAGGRVRSAGGRHFSVDLKSRQPRAISRPQVACSEKAKARLLSQAGFAIHVLALLLLVVDDLVIRLDHIILLGRATLCAGGRAGRLPRLRRRTRLRLLLVERLTGFAEHFRQFFLRRTDLVHVVAAERFARALDGGIDLRLRVG